MRLTPTLFAAALLFGAVSVSTVQPAEATTIAPLTTEQLTDASTYIIEGVVSRVWAEEDETGRVWTRAEVQVSTVFKGPDAPETMIIDNLGGHSWDRVTTVEGQARFSENEHVLVFVDVIRHGTRFSPVGLFHGKLTVRRAPGETRRHAMRWATSPNAPFDAQFLPYPDRERRIYVDDLRAAITARVEQGWDGEPIPGISAERLVDVNLPEKRQVRFVREAN